MTPSSRSRPLPLLLLLVLLLSLLLAVAAAAPVEPSPASSNGQATAAAATAAPRQPPPMPVIAMPTHHKRLVPLSADDTVLLAIVAVALFIASGAGVGGGEERGWARRGVGTLSREGAVG